MDALYIIAYLLVYLWIGFWIGKSSLRTWRRTGLESSHFNRIDRLLFPATAILDHDADLTAPMMTAFNLDDAVSRGHYLVLTAFFWPMRVTLTIVVRILVSCSKLYHGLKFITGQLKKLALGMLSIPGILLAKCGRCVDID